MHFIQDEISYLESQIISNESLIDIKKNISLGSRKRKRELSFLLRFVISLSYKNRLIEVQAGCPEFLRKSEAGLFLICS